MTRRISNTEKVYFSVHPGAAGAAGLTVRKSTYLHGDPWVCTAPCGTTAKMAYLLASFISGPCGRWRLKQVQGS